MPYRRTENVERRLAAREQAILDATMAAASEAGMGAVQMAPIAERAGIAAGTIYRYFPSKTELVADLVGSVCERELAAMRAAAEAAPGPLSALAATIVTFASRALADRKLAWAMTAEPAEPEVDVARLAYRKALLQEIAVRIEIARMHLPAQDAHVAAAAAVGALLEGLVGPLVADPRGDAMKAREAVQMLTLFVLRALGVGDARALGLVAQATA